MDLTLYFGGACVENPGVGGCGAVCYGPKKAFLWEESRRLGRTASNRAELHGLILGLRRLVKDKTDCQHLKVIGDSQLILQFMQGQRKVEDPILRVMVSIARGLASHFPSLLFAQVPHEQNQVAKSLAERRACQQGLVEGEYFVFYPNLCGSSSLIADGMHINVINDFMAYAHTPEILIDARFLASLPSFGHSALTSLGECKASTLSGKVPMTILGCLKSPLPITFMGQEAQIRDVIVVEDLPAPMKISSDHPQIARIMKEENASIVFNANTKLRSDLFPEQFQAHRFWEPSDVHFIAAGYGIQQGMA
ncbi:unnamed protein product [Symbiodinium sp. CCMP2592]|nr:unnamed protein product [Symbiodinium sp. CCMP2592]